MIKSNSLLLILYHFIFRNSHDVAPGVAHFFSICQLDARVKDLPNGPRDFSQLVFRNDEPRG